MNGRLTSHCRTSAAPASRALAGRAGFGRALPTLGPSDEKQEVPELIGDEEVIEGWDGGQIDGQRR